MLGNQINDKLMMFIFCSPPAPRFNIGDAVQTTLTQPLYGYKKPVLIVTAMESRIDGMVIEVRAPDGSTARWIAEDLELKKA